MRHAELLGVAVVLLLATGCTTLPKGAASTDPSAPVTITPEPILRSTEDLSVDVEIPLFPAIPRFQAIQRETRRLVDSFVQEMTDIARSDHADAGKHNMPFRQYQCFARYTVTRNDGRYLSFYIDLYRYTGGAHGGTERHGYIYDAVTGRRLGLDSLFGSLEAARAAIVPATLQVMAKQPRAYFDVTPKALSELIGRYDGYVRGDAVVCFFGQYEIAPYATGIPEIEVPLHEQN